MASDTKKCQTMINICAIQIQNIRDALEVIKAVRDIFVATSPDTTGTPLDGNVSYVGTAINELDTAVNEGINSVVWDQMIASYVESHRNMALEE